MRNETGTFRSGMTSLALANHFRSRIGAASGSEPTACSIWRSVRASTCAQSVLTRRRRFRVRVTIRFALIFARSPGGYNPASCFADGIDDGDFAIIEDAKRDDPGFAVIAPLVG